MPRITFYKCLVTGNNTISNRKKLKKCLIVLRRYIKGCSEQLAISFTTSQQNKEINQQQIITQ